MADKQSTLTYPRKPIIRSLLRVIGRLVISLLFRVKISGEENLPSYGPLIVVGNHTAVMEAVLLIIYAPWQVEMVGAADIPHERISQFFSNLYGFIPVNRGHIDRAALRSALNVLNHNGIIGIFPEGGIWEPGLMRAQTGVSWLSYHGKTPVIPIGFSGTLGSLERGIRLKRPNLTMQIGELIPCLENDLGLSRKVLFNNYAEEVMSRVRKLILPGDPSIRGKIMNEAFSLSITVKDKNNLVFDIPESKQIIHDISLVKFLHRPAILKLFYDNLNLPIEVLLNLDETHDPRVIGNAISRILHYLEDENPYLLTYRFGPKEGEEMKLGLRELYELTQWVAENEWKLYIIPTRKFTSIETNEMVIQTKPQKFEKWM